jgi:hypothetical protein
MQSVPPIPRLADASSALFERGHLWVQEYVDGAPLQFSLSESGRLRFDAGAGWTHSEDLPLPYTHAVREITEQLDRQALRQAVDDPEAIVFAGTATQCNRVAYDWQRLPSFLGCDVLDRDRETLLPPDSVAKIYDRLGLASVNAVEKEVDAAHLDPSSYEVPESAWYDGPAAGLVFRNKTGLRAKRVDIDPVENPSPPPSDATPEALAAEYVTAARIQAAIDRLEASERTVAVEPLYELVVEAIAREEASTLFEEGYALDARAFKSRVAEQVRRRAADRGLTRG